MKSLRALLLIFPVLLFNITALAQSPGSVSQVVSCKDPSSSMLWEVEANGRNIYLFGSIHLGKAEFYPLHNTIEKAFRESDHLVFEVDPASATDPEVLLEMQTRGTLPPGQSLSDVITPEIVNKLHLQMSKMGLPADALMTMQPWYITLMLSSIQMTMQGYSPQYGIESYLMSQKSTATDVMELESILEQINTLEELNAESFLAYTLQSFDDGGEQIEQLMSSWQCSDKASLIEILFSDINEDPIALGDMVLLREKLFYERNRRMATGIISFLENGSGDYFIVVGAGHLLGERSVIELLQSSGFLVNQVRLR
jgi:uncharacterized protein